MSDLTDNQIRGYKATLSNPRVGEEAKQHARELLDGQGTDFESSGNSASHGDESHNRHLGGKKATISNPRTSESAKQQARDELDAADDSGDYEEDSSGAKTGGDEHNNRVMGGYKATLKNPNVGEKAKEHAREMLGEDA